MDIPLTSDALDIAFHPDGSTHLIAAGLLSGKVQLIDYTAAVNAAASSSASEAATTAASAFKKTVTLRPSIKSTRALAFSSHDAGATLWAASKDRSLFAIDTATGVVRSHWANTHAAPPSRMITLDSGMLVTGDDDGGIKLWDPRLPTTSASTASSSASSTTEPATKKAKLSSTSLAASTASSASAGPSTATPVRSYAHHFDWISDLLWCDHLAPPKPLPPPASASAAAKAKSKAAHQDATGSLRSRLVATSGDGSLSVIDFRQDGGSGHTAKEGASDKKKAKEMKGVEVSEDQEDELLAIAPVKGGSKFVVGTQLGILSVWAPTRAMLDHVDRIPGHPASVDTLCSLHDGPSSSSTTTTTKGDDVVARFAQDDDVLLTGSSDGLIRILQIGPPHKLLGVLADHGGGGLPVERIRRKGRWVASIGHESAIKWSDLADLLDGPSDDEDEEVGEGEGGEAAARRTGRSGADSEEDESDSEKDDEDASEAGNDDEEDAPRLRPGRRAEDDKDADSDSDSDSGSDSDAPPRQRRPTPSKDKAAKLSKGIPAGALLSTTLRPASEWDDGDEDGGKKGKKGGVKKKIRGHDRAAAERAGRAAFFADM